MLLNNKASASEGGFTTLGKLQKQHKNMVIKVISGPDSHETYTEEEHGQGREDSTH